MNETNDSSPKFPVQLPLAMLVGVPGSYFGLAAYLGLPSIGFAP